MTDNGGFIRTAKNVGIVAGALTACLALTTWFAAVAWKTAMEPYFAKQTTILTRLAMFDVRQRAMIESILADSVEEKRVARLRLLRAMADTP